MSVGKNSHQLNLTISKKAFEYMQMLADRGTSWGPSPTAIGHNIVMKEIDRLIDLEVDPDRWRAPKA